MKRTGELDKRRRVSPLTSIVHQLGALNVYELQELHQRVTLMLAELLATITDRVLR